MLVKFASVIVLFAFASFGDSTPHHHHHDHHHEHKDNHDDHGHHGHDDHHDTEHWKFVDPKMINSPFYKSKNVSNQLYKEFFVLATGDNLESPEVGNDVHINARAVVLLSQKLHHMKKVYEILADHVTEYGLKGVKVDDKQTMTDLVNDIVTEMKNIPEFDTIKNGLSDSFISRQKYFKKDGDKMKEMDAWIRDPLIQSATLNKMFFMMTCHQNRLPFNKIAQTMVELSEDKEWNEKLEKVYSTSMAETIKEFCPGHESHKAQERFTRSIMDQLMEDPVLAFKLYASHKIMILNTDF